MRWTNTARVVLLGVAALAIRSQTAFADTATLICHLYGNDAFIEDEPTTIELNEAQNSVVLHIGANHYAPQYFGGRAEQAASAGPLPAIFGSDTITFNNDTAAYTGPYTLNRLTGVMVNSQLGWRWNCQAGKKQF